MVIGDLNCRLVNVRTEYRGRFGVETSHHLLNQAHAHTTGRDPK